MFRKPKRAAKAGLRRKKRQEEDDDNDEGDKETSRELQQARKRAKASDEGVQKNEKESSVSTGVMHQYEASTKAPVSQKELATRTNEHHPTKTKVRTNKFLAGPIKAPTNIRTTCRFDYQPDICKDYKDTGFCGFGDSCIYLHDRGDTMSGWQLEQEWEKQQQLKKKQQQEQMEAFMNGGESKDNETNKITGEEDGIPFACYLCREEFKEPVVTACAHYYCQACISSRLKESMNCPICGKDTHGVLNEPTKLLSKKRRLIGRQASWKEYMETCQKKATDTS